MKTSYVLIIFLNLCYIFSLQSTELTLSKRSNHFIVWYTTLDESIIDSMVTAGECCFEKLTCDFKHIYSQHINIHVYPDLASFHDALNWSDAPSWVVGSQGDINSYWIVSPQNPGQSHSYESIMKVYCVGLVELFIYDKYSQHFDIPRWLHQGVGLYKADFISPKKVNAIKNSLEKFPSFSLLESIGKEAACDTISFGEIDGFAVSFLIVQFIDQAFGWDFVLALLENYTDFEKIFSMTKDEFMEQCKQFIASLDE